MKKAARNKLRHEILKTLERYSEARDNDVKLMLLIWRDFYPTRVHRTEPTEEKKNGRAYVFCDDMLILPREDDIKRLRAKIQNEEKKWLPTSWIVAKKRRMKEADWLEYVRKSKEPQQQSFPQKPLAYPDN